MSKSPNHIIPHRSFLQTAILAGLAGLLFFTGCGPIQTALDADNPFFFIQMSDIQFGYFADNKNFDRETELFEKAVAHANRIQPTFVINTGDLIHKTHDQQQTAELFRIAAQLDPAVPIYWVAGNHDVKDVPTQESLNWYRRHIGKDWYSFDSNKCHFIVLNSCLFKDSTNVPDQEKEQLLWLQQDLAQTAAIEYRHIIVFMHHPLFLLKADEPEEYFNIPPASRRQYLELFHQYQVTAVFAGHIHRNNIATDGALAVIGSGAVGKPFASDPPGFRIVKVYPDHIEHNYYGLDEVPQTVDMKPSIR